MTLGGTTLPGAFPQTGPLYTGTRDTAYAFWLHSHKPVALLLIEKESKQDTKVVLSRSLVHPLNSECWIVIYGDSAEMEVQLSIADNKEGHQGLLHVHMFAKSYG